MHRVHLHLMHAFIFAIIGPDYGLVLLKLSSFILSKMDIYIHTSWSSRIRKHVHVYNSLSTSTKFAAAHSISGLASKAI